MAFTPFPVHFAVHSASGPLFVITSYSIHYTKLYDIHTTVLLHEVIEWLRPQPGGRYMDGTLGMGGHSLALMQAAGGKAELLGLDRDEVALSHARRRLEEFADGVHLYHLPFSRFEDALDDLGWDAIRNNFV